MSGGGTRIGVVASLVAGVAVGAAATLCLLPEGGSGGRADFRAPLGASVAGPEGAERFGAVPRFTDITARAGIDFVHENGHSGRLLYPEIMGGGVGLLDYDGDGLLDIYFVNGNRLRGEPDPEVTNRLYHNEGDGRFRDVTRAAGVGDPGYGQGCCAGDYDNDGDLDLYVSNLGPDRLYENRGDGTFTDVTAAAGLANDAWGQSCSFLDYDGDGWLDLYVQNYLTIDVRRDFDAWVWIGARKVRDYPSPREFPGAADRLFRGHGDGTFTDVTEAAGLYRPGGKGMGCACADLDGDRLVDLFVANDTMENFFFRNRGDGTFEEVALARGLAFDGLGIPEASMGVDLGDYDRDGRPDLAVPCLREQIFTLYRNGGGHFGDASWSSGLTGATSGLTGFSASFLDYDDDGDLDLFFTGGAVRALELAPEGAGFRERYGLPDVLLAGDGKGGFHDVSSLAGEVLTRPSVSRGSAVGDIDGDGDLDLVVGRLRDRPALLRNDTPGGHWIGLELRARSGSLHAFGAEVTVEAGGLRQWGVVHGAVTYLSQSDRRLHFGLGEARRVERVVIRWPSGARQELAGLEVDRLHRLREPDPTSTRPPPRAR